jgi:CubicO group peptidase (beta-lactamase class C family)
MASDYGAPRPAARTVAGKATGTPRARTRIRPPPLARASTADGARETRVIMATVHSTLGCVPILFMTLFSVPVALGEPSEPPAKIASLVWPLLAGKKGVALVIGVVERSRQRLYHFGSLAPGADAPPDGDTVFEIGSITKVFTTCVLAKMVRDGTVRLEDPVNDYLPPELRVPGRSDKAVTLLHLATHTSGLPIAPANLRWHVLLRPSDWDDPYAHYGLEQLHASLSECRLERDPGDVYDYSNLGMGLLGMALVRRAKAASYDELIRRSIADPLGMKDTGIALSASQRARFAPGHDDDGEPTAAWDFETLEGFGALRSTANDLMRFLATNLGFVPTPLAAAFGDCHRPRRDTPDKQVRVGLGWHVLSPPGWSEPVICHSGETGGARSFVGFLEKRGVGVVVLCNSAQLGGEIDRIGLVALNE